MTFTDSIQVVAEAGAGPVVARTGRVHRRHRPGRGHTIKVTYDDEELSAVRAAADAVGLTPAGYVGEAAVAAARDLQSPAHVPFRDVVVELIAIRAALTALSTRGHLAGIATGADSESALMLQILRAAVVRIDAVAAALTGATRRRAGRRD